MNKLKWYTPANTEGVEACDGLHHRHVRVERFQSGGAMLHKMRRDWRSCCYYSSPDVAKKVGESWLLAEVAEVVR